MFKGTFSESPRNESFLTTFAASAQHPHCGGSALAVNLSRNLSSLSPSFLVSRSAHGGEADCLSSWPRRNTWLLRLKTRCQTRGTPRVSVIIPPSKDASRPREASLDRSTFPYPGTRIGELPLPVRNV